MSVGDRQQPEKNLDAEFRPKAFKRDSRKKQKVEQNRKTRRQGKLNPETLPKKKYFDFEW